VNFEGPFGSFTVRHIMFIYTFHTKLYLKMSYVT